MKLDKYWSVNSDKYGWELVYEKTGTINPKTGKPKISSKTSYHANLKQCLITYLDETLKPSETIVEALERIKEVEEKIEKICK